MILRAPPQMVLWGSCCKARLKDGPSVGGRGCWGVFSTHFGKAGLSEKCKWFFLGPFWDQTVPKRALTFWWILGGSRDPIFCAEVLFLVPTSDKTPVEKTPQHKTWGLDWRLSTPRCSIIVGALFIRRFGGLFIRRGVGLSVGGGYLSVGDPMRICIYIYIYIYICIHIC